MRSQSVRACAILWVVIHGGVALAQTITGVGFLPGGTQSDALAVSPDGTAVTGRAQSSSGTSHAFLWTPSGGMQNLGTLPGHSLSQGLGVANGGLAVVGGSRGSRFRPFRWTSAGGMQDLGDIPGANVGDSQANAVSPDGSTVVGYNGAAPIRAFRWTPGGGMADLGTISPQSTYSSAFAVSATGAVTGISYSRLFLWTAATGVQNLGAMNGGTSVGLGIGEDASVIVGYANSPDPNSFATYGFRWTAATGFAPLHPFPNEVGSEALGTNQDGSVIVGASGFSVVQGAVSYDTPFIWTINDGPMDLRVYLASRGVDLAGWQLQVARQVSADGRVIVGQGLHNGVPEGWVVTLPPPCGSADFNCDGDTGTDADIEAFFACIAGICPPAPCASTADFNGDGDVGTDADIEAFFRVLAGGSC